MLGSNRISRRLNRVYFKFQCGLSRLTEDSIAAIQRFLKDLLLLMDVLRNLFTLQYIFRKLKHLTFPIVAVWLSSTWLCSIKLKQIQKLKQIIHIFKHRFLTFI